MKQLKDGGTHDIANAIPVCFECHAEIHSYNVDHPRGRRFTEEELRKHKQQWLAICQDQPGELLESAWDRDVGPLQALIDEMEFNQVLAEQDTAHRGALFYDDQFKRAITQGIVATLDPELKQALLSAYAAVGTANQRIQSQNARTGMQASYVDQAVERARPLLRRAQEKLLNFLASAGD